MRPVKPLLFLLFIILFTNTAFSQAENVFFLDDNKKPTEKPKRAKFLVREKKVSDTCWQVDTYNFSGPLIKTERFNNKERSVKHGRFCYYTAEGRIDSINNFANGQLHGRSFYWNDTGRIYLEKEYARGVLINTVDLIKKFNEMNRDSTIKSVDKESEFPGGLFGWKKYLEKNLRYPERALKQNAKGEVRVQFIVDKEGNISDIEISRSVEFSIDEEAMRIIRKSPKWTPAEQDGRIVRSYKIQPLYFSFGY